MNDPVRNQLLDDPPEFSPQDAIAGQVRTGQIITFALIQGVIVVTAVMLYLVLANQKASADADAGDAVEQVAREPNEGGDLVLPALSLLIGMGAAIAATTIVPALRRTAAARFRTQQQSKLNPAATESYLSAWGTSTVIGQAVCEGAAMLCAVLMLVGETLLPLIPIALLLAGIALLCPTESKIRHALELLDEGINRG
ncbi:MAG: hypothetical protein AAGA03_16955 [Planctomycetota bacterium]